MDLFNDFKDYIKENNYELEEISDDSIRGVKGELKIHLFKDHMNQDYIFNVNDKGYKVYNTIFIEDEEGYKLTHKNDNRKFNNLIEIIDYTKDNIKIEI